MYLAKWSWRNEWKVFLIDKLRYDDTRSLQEATNVARCHVGAAGTLVVSEIKFTTVKSHKHTRGRIDGVAPIMSSEDMK